MKNKIVTFLSIAGLTWFIPIVRLIAGEDPKTQVREIAANFGIPSIAFVVFLVMWSLVASQIQTSLGQVPGPAQIWEAGQILKQEHAEERANAEAFYERQEKRNAKKLAEDPNAEIKVREYAGRPTYIDQIITSLYTVFTGFLIASFIAIPVGIICGLSETMMKALGPLIQIFKPVSPLAWLPIVTMIVSALYTTNDGWFEKSFLTSAITVALCSLWPSLLNTALGVASMDKDYINVAAVLKLGIIAKIFKIVLPSSLPLLFTGLRISLGVGWMVLIAAEMLAQNPGLGKFVWDEFQNGSSQSLAKIIFAVFTIGFIGFGLDRVMVVFQKLVSFSDDPISA